MNPNNDHKIRPEMENYELGNTYVSRNEVELDLNPVKRRNPNKAPFLGERSKTVDF